jgi:glycosyltransferase involved in cell wall biosynthesis
MLARNVAANLPYIAQVTAQIGRRFRKYAVVIFENDSTDNTLAELQSQLEVWPVHILRSATYGDQAWPHKRLAARAVAMGNYRTELQTMVRDKFSNYDFALTLDSDLQYIDVDGVFHSLSHIADCSGVASYGLRRSKDGRRFDQYDVWAYRSLDRGWAPYPNGSPAVMRAHHSIAMPPFQVLSAFGGMALYKMKPYLKGCYTSSVDVDCEHVCFHRHMLKLVLNPAQVTVA